LNSTLKPGDATSRSELHNWRIIKNAAGKSDATLVVLSHGFGTDHRSWRLLLPELLKHYDIGVYDLAGAGPGGRSNFDLDRHTSINSFADDLIAILDEQGITRCELLSHSVSGMVGLVASRKHPELFAHISMIAASPRYINDDDYHGGFSQTDLDGLFGAMEASYEGWANGFAPVVVGDDFPDFIGEFVAGLMDMPPATAIQIARFIFQSDMREMLPDITVPVTIIQPRNDAAVPMAVGAYLHEKLPNSTLAVIDSKGHLPHLTAPYEVLHCMRQRLAA
jgi:sigma-B regulation protein RsbQ